jgi:hypothetical protein
LLRGWDRRSLDSQNGEVFKQERLNDAIDGCFASPLLLTEWILCQSGRKVVAIWEVLAINDLGEECSATPAIADDRIHIRTRSPLWLFRQVTKRGKTKQWEYRSS